MQVVVIGGVAAGMSAAAKLKRNLRDGVDIVCYAKGGAVSYGACGLPFYVSDHIKTEAELVERRPEQFAESGITVKVHHEVTGVDTAGKTVHVKNLDSGEEFDAPYDKLIIGSGADVKKFPPFDRELDGLCQVRDVDDGNAVKSRLQTGGVTDVVIVGAGFIGLEMVEACKKYAPNVSVVELAPRVLTPLDPEFSQRLEDELVKNGVRVYTGAKVTELESENGKVTAAVVEKDGAKTSIPCQMVLNCAGIAPATGFIGGVEKSPNGAILVNEKMETSIPDVYAAGDCSVMKHFLTGQYTYTPLGTNANKQGRIIADVLGGKQPKPFALVGCTAMRLFGTDVAKVGLSEEDAARAGLDFKTNTITGNSYASYYGKEKVVVKVVYDAKTRKILGAQTCGQGIVVPRANYYAIAIRAGLTVDEFGFMDLCYSPPFGGVWDAAIIASNTAK